MQIAATQLQMVKHVTFKDPAGRRAEYLVRPEVIILCQKLEFKRQIMHIDNNILVLLQRPDQPAQEFKKLLPGPAGNSLLKSGLELPDV